MAPERHEIKLEDGNVRPELVKVMSFDSKNERQDLRKELVSAPRDEFRESIESGFGIHRVFYESGSAAAQGDELKEAQKKEPDAVIASVDSEGFAQIWHDPDWYREYLTAAKELSSIYDVLDADTKLWFDDLKPLIDGFVALEGLSSRDFKRKYKSEIWKLTKANGSKKIYGPRGAFNFLLAYNRAKNAFPGIVNASADKFVLKLVLGEGVGDKGGAKDRFAATAVRIVQVRGAEAEVEAPVRKPVEDLAVEPEAGDVEGPKVEQPEEPKEVVAEFMSDAFYKQFGISDPADVESFRGYYDGFRPILGQLAVVKAEDYWENLNKADTDSLYARGKAEGYWFQVATLEEFRTGFEAFWKSDSPQAVELRELNFWLLRRLIEYNSDTSHEVVSPDGYEVLCRRLVDAYDGVDRASLNDRTVLLQLIDAAHYLSKNDVLDPESWAVKESFYKGILEKL